MALVENDKEMLHPHVQGVTIKSFSLTLSLIFLPLSSQNLAGFQLAIPIFSSWPSYSNQPRIISGCVAENSSRIHEWIIKVGCVGTIIYFFKWFAFFLLYDHITLYSILLYCGLLCYCFLIILQKTLAFLKSAYLVTDVTSFSWFGCNICQLVGRQDDIL